jgi:hypothetical protein
MHMQTQLQILLYILGCIGVGYSRIEIWTCMLQQCQPHPYLNSRSAVEVLEARLQDFPDIELGIVSFSPHWLVLSSLNKGMLMVSRWENTQKYKTKLNY